MVKSENTKNYRKAIVKISQNRPALTPKSSKCFIVGFCYKKNYNQFSCTSTDILYFNSQLFMHVLLTILLLVSNVQKLSKSADLCKF